MQSLEKLIETEVSFKFEADYTISIKMVASDLHESRNEAHFNDFLIEAVRGERLARVLDAPNGALAMSIRQLMDRQARRDALEMDELSNELRLPAAYRPAFDH